MYIVHCTNMFKAIQLIKINLIPFRFYNTIYFNKCLEIKKWLDRTFYA